MLKIVHADIFKLGRSFLDEVHDVDWGDDEARPQSSGRISPHGPQGVVDEGNFEQYEPSVAEPETPDQEETAPELGAPETPEIPDYRREIPTANELLGIPEGTNELEYDKPQQLVYDGIDADDVISFDYTNRFGHYAGKDGNLYIAFEARDPNTGKMRNKFESALEMVKNITIKVKSNSTIQ